MRGAIGWNERRNEERMDYELTVSPRGLYSSVMVLRKERDDRGNACASRAASDSTQ
jgi:hypothetical protein